MGYPVCKYHLLSAGKQTWLPILTNVSIKQVEIHQLLARKKEKQYQMLRD